MQFNQTIINIVFILYLFLSLFVKLFDQSIERESFVQWHIYACGVHTLYTFHDRMLCGPPLMDHAVNRGGTSSIVTWLQTIA